MLTKKTWRRLVITSVVAWLSATSAMWVFASPNELQLASAEARELWLKGSDQVLAGDFVGAAGTIEKLHKLEPGDSEIGAVLTWLREAKDLSESREHLRVKNYEHFVAEALKAAKEAKEAPPPGEADKNVEAEKKLGVTGEEREEAIKEAIKEAAKKKLTPPAGDEDEEGVLGTIKESDPAYKWGTALRYAQAAMANAKDEDDFRSQPWLQEMVDNVLVEIERHQGLGQWRDAVALYVILRELYPERKEFEDGFNASRKRAHIEMVYGPKSTWQTDLRGVNAGAIKEILGRMESDYVEDVDFRALCLSGLEQMVILAETRSLKESFPTLGDQDLVDHFSNRVNGVIKNCKREKSKFKPRDIRSAFEQVLKINEDSLRLPECILVDEFIAGLMDPLDEFTAVIWPAEVDEFNKHTRGEFVGVGIQITKPEGQPVRVESPLENTPACRAGVKPGDFITHIDGKSTVDITVMQAVRLITGEPGTTVTLTLKDPMTEVSHDLILKREMIEIRTIAGHKRDESKPTGWDYFLDAESKIGYVRVSGFMDKTVSDLKAVLKQLRNEDCRGLILDLRFNPGGLLTSARDMCELFLHSDDPIVRTRGRNHSQDQEIHARAREGWGELPLIVLVNEYSASASEIVAGALAGKRQACVIGDRTFGKGSVQNLIPIADNQAYLKLTTAHYYIYDMDLPSTDPWFCLHKRPGAKVWGVEPHVKVKVIPQEVNKILRLRRERDVLKGKDQAEVPKEVLDRLATTQPNPHLQEDENPDVDPQLVAALDLMRIKLLSHQPWALAPRNESALMQAKAEAAKTPAVPAGEARR